MTMRESTRNRKYKQVIQHKIQIVQAELSIRWWYRHKCYHQFVPVVLNTDTPPFELEAS